MAGIKGALDGVLLHSNSTEKSVGSCTSTVASGGGTGQRKAVEGIMIVIDVPMRDGGLTMTIKTALWRVLAVAAVGLATITAAPATPASAQAGPPVEAQVACAQGFVCLQVNSGAVILVAEGESRTFPGGITVTSFANLTKLDYCVGGNPNFSLPSGARLDRIQRVNSLAPGRFCLT